MDDTIRRLIVWHQDEILRLTTMLTANADSSQGAGTASLRPMEREPTQQPLEFYSPPSTWSGDTQPLTPALQQQQGQDMFGQDMLSQDMFVVPETPPMRTNVFTEFLDTLVSDNEETQ